MILDHEIVISTTYVSIADENMSDQIPLVIINESDYKILLNLIIYDLLTN